MHKPLFDAVHLLVLPEVHLMDLAGPAQVFCNERLGLDVRYISPSANLIAAQGLALSQLESLPSTVAGNSGLFVVGSQHMFEQLNTEAVHRSVSWLQAKAGSYAFVAAVCSGSLLLAKAGLLGGLRCTTHHDLVDTLRAVSAKAKVEENCLFVEDGDVLTSAGICTRIDLISTWSIKGMGHRWRRQ